MVFRRDGRPGWSFQARTPDGWKQLGTGMRSKPMANQVEAMWENLTANHRAWDLCTRVLTAGRMAPKEMKRLYDLYESCRRDVGEMRRRQKDVDVEPMVEDFLKVYRRSVRGADTADHVEVHLRHLLPAELPRLASTVTPAWLSERLSAYVGKQNTVRKVHSSWSQFFAYATKTRRAFLVTPMEDVSRPKVVESPIQFHEMAAVEKIVTAQPTPERKALMALAYGAALEVSVTVDLKAGDCLPASREIRGAGTKAFNRDRVVRVADWAWPYLAAVLKGKMPNARLFPAGLTRWTVSDWHRETQKALGLPVYKLHNARDHWAVRQIRAGTPVAVVQAQLGHGSPMLTLRKYGRFIPGVADREHWEKQASRFEAKRRKNEGA